MPRTTYPHVEPIDSARQVLHRWEVHFESGAAAARAVRDNANVPVELHGNYIVTGKQFREECSNLAHAFSVWECERRAKNIWKEVDGIKLLVTTF